MPLVIAGMVLAAGCGDNGGPLGLARAFKTPENAGCTYASPVVAAPGGDATVITATTEGVVAAYGIDGTARWQVTLPAPAGFRAWIGATPAVIDDRLIVVAWQETVATGEERTSHRVAVLDAATGAIDPAFPIVTLAASVPASGGGTVDFLPAYNFSRSQLVHARRAGEALGVVYVSFGNLRDIQPWHGWVFELDLDRWRADGAAAAISARLLTTPEADCGRPGGAGADDMLCGGGVWAPSGPTVVPRGDDYELWIPTGNGLLDLPTGQLANTVIRSGRGLVVDPACGPVCAPFDPIAPADSCMESCRDLFIPRLAPGDPPLAPPAGRCDGLSFLECYAALDLDLGASTPAVATTPAGREVAILPAAGVVGLDLVDDVAGPRLRERWSAPAGDTDEAVGRFREHTGRAAVIDDDVYGPQVVIADPGEHDDGRLYLIDAATGAIRDRGALDGGGRKYIRPAVLGQRAFVTSCTGGPDRGMLPGSSHLEGWDLVRR